MGASFHNIGEIKALAGVDFLTIAPSLLEQLKNDTSPVPKKLDSHAGEQSFSWIRALVLLTVGTNSRGGLAYSKVT